MLLLATAVFVGSAVCQPCHPKIAADYAKTPMAQSSGRVTAVPNGEFTAANHRYRVANNRLFFDQGEANFDYFIGSNTAGRSYLFAREGYLFELPVTWYQRASRWDASPGYEHEAAVRLNRPVDPTCLSCHASRLQPIYGTQNRYADPPFIENGISCERCHGPGSEHARDPRTQALANPAKLPSEERDAVCEQCHLTGEARVEKPGRRFAEYRPGMKLSVLVTYLVWQNPPTGLKVTSHVEKLSQSLCLQKSGGKLSCSTCHDVHANVTKGREVCLTCHTVPHGADENCLTCHMPKTGTSDVAHSVVTDHSIPGKRRTAAGEPALIAFRGTADDRALALGYAELDDPRAGEYLKRARPADAAVLLRLNQYEAVLRTEPSNTTALVNLGVIHASAGKTADAAALWRRALEANPAIEGASLNLAKISPPTEARVILRRYLTFDPGSVAVRSALESLR
ncbi:MAG: tetratricopeptide repeat protein [Bryobacterales bacterium]|nr:tetratricopeptide repeat protein [Bryobacterales bacterium]